MQEKGYFDFGGSTIVLVFEEGAIRFDEDLVKNTAEGLETFGAEPGWPWAHDMKDFHLNGRHDPGFDATRDFRATRENVYFLSALLADSPLRVRLDSEGSLAARAEVTGSGEHRRVRLVAANLWSFLGLAWGNAVGDPIVLTPGFRGKVRVRLTDTDRYAGQP